MSEENKFQSQKFYVTTPIYYPTAKPHLGSLYSTLLADVAARWHKLLGAQVFFLTGTDEHGQKIAQAAEKAGVAPQTFVDNLVGEYTSMWHKYELAYDKFIRTTDPEHVQAVQLWLQKLIDRDLIYKANYEGYYCTPCETFITETAVREQDLAVILCTACQRPTSYLTEENYFFRLAKYQDQLLNFYAQNPNFIVPKERLNEVIKFVESGLRDLCLSRSTVTWGIKFPGDSKHVTYVWADALNNYISGVGYGNPHKTVEFNFWWPADLHVMGKDIVRFHAVYWPAFLLASDLPLPKQLLVHGWLKINDQKMSKSLGNAVDPEELLKTYGADPVRYYLVSQMAITRDSEFSILDLEQKISSDLANDLGNLLNRTVQLAAQNNCLNLPVITNWSESSQKLKLSALTILDNYAQYMHDNCAYLALAELWKLIKLTNAFFHEQAPWVLAKTDSVKFIEVLSAVCHILRAIAILSWPVLPSKSHALLQRLGQNNLALNLADIHNLLPLAPQPAHLEWSVAQSREGCGEHKRTVVSKNLILELKNNHWDLDFNLQAGEPLFTRYDQVKTFINPLTPSEIEGRLGLSKKNNSENKKVIEKTIMSTENINQENLIPNYITIEELTKVELVVGTIIACDPIEKSDKLYKLQVDCGTYGVRQILSGIKQHFAPADLLNRQALFVLNLKPRLMLGLESQGMMLLAKDAVGNLQSMAPLGIVPNGTRLS